LRVFILIKAVIIFLYLFITACSPSLPAPPIADSERNVLEITDLFQTGHSRFAQALTEDSLLQRTWLGRRDQVVMILIDIEWEDGDLEQAQQSGIILNGGKLILTAGHGFIIEDGTILDIRARHVNGDEVQIEILGIRYDKEQVPLEDWALLRPHKQLVYKQFVATQESTDRQKLILLGYPGALGLDVDERVIHVHESDSPQVFPLGVICRHHIVDQHTLFPLAGTIPLRGISGAPIFDRNGELKGLFSSIGRRRTITGWDYIFGMANIPWHAIERVSSK
jgi:hypothetical protein